MNCRVPRVFVAAACLLWLAGCEPATKGGPSFRAAVNDTTSPRNDGLGAVHHAPLAEATADVTGSVYARAPRAVIPGPTAWPIVRV